MASRQVKFSKLVLERKPPKSGRDEWRDTESPLVMVITSKGARSFSVRFRIRGQKEQVRMIHPGSVTTKTLPAARAWASDVLAKAKGGIDPRPQPAPVERAPEAFETVVKTFIDRYAKRNNKTWKETERLFNTYVLPVWGKRPFTEIRRRDVNTLLNQIEDGKLEVEGEMLGGPTTADRVLAAVRKLFNWYATTDDDFVSPIVKGMARTKPSERARKRILSDDEIRALWAATNQPSEAGGLDPYCAAVRALLLTAQRKSKVNFVRRSDMLDGVRVPTADGKEIVVDRVWDPAADDDGENKQVGIVPLPKSVRDLLMAQPVIGKDDKEHQDWIFTLDGKRPINSWSQGKTELDVRMLKALRERAKEAGEDPEKVTLPGWIHHDLRRTAKTLMTRAGVRPDISERVLGHVISGVEGVYDRWAYATEKKDALEKLATLVERIVTPPADNVVNLAEAR